MGSNIPEFAAQIMQEVKEDFLQAHPCKWEYITIQLLRVETARIEVVTHQSINILFCTSIYFLIKKTNRDISRYAKEQCKSK
jgi:hypothetical protein